MGRARGLQPAVHGELWERKELPVLSSSLLPNSTAGNQLKSRPAALQPQQSFVPSFAAIPLVGFFSSFLRVRARIKCTGVEVFLSDSDVY